MPKKYTIEFVLDFVKDASFQCLETKYYDNKTLMKWKCNECDYEWYACFSSIKNQKSGCPACANNITFTIEEVKQMGLHNGYTLISDEYTNAATIMEWRCAENHVYFSTLANIRDKAGIFTRGVLKGEFRDGIGLQGFTGVDNFKKVTQVLGGDPQDVSFEIHQYTGDNRNVQAQK